MKVADLGKTGDKLTMMGGSRNQGVDIIGENMLLLLYTRFVRVMIWFEKANMSYVRKLV